MSITINNKKIPLLESDTVTTVKERIAMEFGTLPQFISNMTKIQDSNVSLLLKEIEDDPGSSFLDFMKNRNIIEKFPEMSMDIKSLIKLWVIYNKNVKGDQFYIIMAEDEFKKEYNITLNIKRFIEMDEKDMKIELGQKIKKNAEKAKKFFTINSEIEILKEIKHLPFKKEKSVYTIRTNITENQHSLSYIFQKIICNEYVPFSTYNGIYKLYNDPTTSSNLKIPDDWSMTLDDVILLKIFSIPEGSKGSILDPNLYTDCLITFGEDKTMIINLNVDYSRTSNEILRSRIMTTLTDIETAEEEEESLSGMILFPGQSFDTYVMSDLIMNNVHASNFMVVDENVKATKKTSGLYLHFFVGGTEGTCSIISKISDRTDQDLTGIDKRIIQMGTEFIRMRINRVKNLEIAESFISMFSKIMNVYKKEYDPTIAFYKQYIKNFGDKKIVEKIIQKPLTLRELVPDLFPPGYSRSCANLPTIIDDDEIKEYEENNIQVMQFPKTSEEGQQHNYVCEDDGNGFVYIGLHKNKYLPCCFRDDQRVSGSNAYKEYYEGKAMERRVQQNIIKTNKLAQAGEFAFLPESLEKMFSSIDLDSDFLRQGVRRGKQSFLECVLKGVLKRKFKLEEEHKKLVEYPTIGVSSQENPGKDVEQIRSILGDRSSYMNPKLWIRLLETVYNCKIFIFSRQKNSKDVVLEIPNYEKVYLQFVNISNTVLFIYEHWGNESDGSLYPQCELITKRSGDDDTLNFVGKITIEIEELQKKYLKQFWYSQYSSKMVQIKMISTNLLKLPFVSQIIDKYGKARGFETANGLVLLCPPLPPFNLPLKEMDGIYNGTDIGEVIKFIDTINGITIISQCVKPWGVCELNITYSDVLFTIKIRGNKSLEDVKIENIEKYPRQSENPVEMYNITKRLATILVEYFIFLFSKYIEGQDKITLEDIKTFVETKIEVGETQYFSPDLPTANIEYFKSVGFVNEENDRLVVDSEETLKRLVYSLRLRIANDEKNVLEYYKKLEIENFYSFEEFNVHPKNNFVTKTLKTVQSIRSINNNVYNKIQSDGKKYFLKNKHIRLSLVGSTLPTKTEKSITYFYDQNGIQKRRSKKDTEDRLVYKRNDKIVSTSIKFL